MKPSTYLQSRWHRRRRRFPLGRESRRPARTATSQMLPLWSNFVGISGPRVLPCSANYCAATALALGAAVTAVLGS